MKTIADLKVGDRIHLVLNDDARWEDGEPPGIDGFDESQTYRVYRMDEENDPWFVPDECPVGDEEDWRDEDRAFYGYASRPDDYPIKMAKAVVEIADKSSFPTIPDFPINFRFDPSRMSSSQKQMVIDSAKDTVESWVRRNYRAWPLMAEMHHSIVGDQLKTKWVATPNDK